MGVACGEEWLLLEERSNTGKLLRAWLAGRGSGIRPAIEADTFDLIVNLVSMGMGCSIVPHRALALYPKARAVRRAVLRPRLTRELVVVTRKDRRPPEHLAQFIDSILFT